MPVQSHHSDTQDVTITVQLRYKRMNASGYESLSGGHDQEPQEEEEGLILFVP